MLNVQRSSVITRDKGDNSPDVSRRKRPLSIIEENQDDDDDERDETRLHHQSASSSSSSPTTLLQKSKEAVESSNPQSPSEDNTNNKSTNSAAGETSPKRPRTRRSGVFSLQSPVMAASTSVGVVPLNQSPINSSIRPTNDHASVGSVAVSEHANYTDQTVSGTEGDFSRLRDKAAKLNLKTRRQSYLVWRAKYVDQPRDLAEVKVVPRSGGKLTKARMDKMDNDLKWIWDQLRDMRRQDQSLAKQLLGINQELSSLRLQVSCEEHQELLEEAQEEMDDLRELSRFADFPSGRMDSPLRQIGVTKMNLSSRRFSTC